MSEVAIEQHVPSKKEIRLVIAASSAGTIFEWYDFFIYGTLAAIIGTTFFPSGNQTLETLLVWAGFAVGFGFRPLGAVLFGFLGDKVGRKYTFLVTVTLMGIATAGVGLLPSAATIGIAAPIIIILLRIMQGLALGGEYGGAAIYVAEHSPPEKRGFYTSFIQASVAGGFVLSLIVVLSCRYLMPTDVWESWGWRVPFLLSLILLAISLWMRLKLSESPVFKAMKEAGEIAKNPVKESFTYPGNTKRILIALFGVAAGLTVIWYTAMFSGLTFLKGPMRVEPVVAEMIVGLAAACGLGFFVYFGRLSDKIGRKKPIIWGYALTIIAVFPLFWTIGSQANPNLSAALEKAPITISGEQCDYNPFADKQESQCGNIIQSVASKSLPYDVVKGEGGPILNIGSETLIDLNYDNDEQIARSNERIDTALAEAGYDFAPVTPPAQNIIFIILALVGLSALSGATYGPVAALLSEMFPAKVRYSSMSIPYHIGAGYFGGFLPLIASVIVAFTGDLYAGLWYTIAITFIALVVGALGLPNGKITEFENG